MAKRESFDLRTALCSLTTALVMTAGLTLAGASPASALERVASDKELAEEHCRGEVYRGYLTAAAVEQCGDALFAVPTSPAFKCGLYREAGFYPSGLMRKACKLYDAGVIKAFIQDLAGD